MVSIIKCIYITFVIVLFFCSCNNESSYDIASEGNLAFNNGKKKYPNANESDIGWGQGLNKWALIDGVQIQLQKNKVGGFAFTGGDKKYLEDCGSRSIVINFGEPKVFNKIYVYYYVWHNDKINHCVPKKWHIDHWNSEYNSWDNLCCDSLNQNDIQTISYISQFSNIVRIESTFDKATSNKIRYWFNNCEIQHGWVTEIEVYNSDSIMYPKSEIVPKDPEKKILHSIKKSETFKDFNPKSLINSSLVILHPAFDLALENNYDSLGKICFQKILGIKGLSIDTVFWFDEYSEKQELNLNLNNSLDELSNLIKRDSRMMYGSPINTLFTMIDSLLICNNFSTAEKNSMLVKLRISVANIYFHWDAYRQSSSTYEKVWEENQYNLDEVLDTIETISFYNNYGLSLFYSDSVRKDKAIALLYRALDLSKLINNNRMSNKVLYNLANCFYQLNDYKKSKIHLNNYKKINVPGQGMELLNRSNYLLCKIYFSEMKYDSVRYYFVNYLKTYPYQDILELTDIQALNDLIFDTGDSGMIYNHIQSTYNQLMYFGAMYQEVSDIDNVYRIMAEEERRSGQNFNAAITEERNKWYWAMSSFGILMISLFFYLIFLNKRKQDNYFLFLSAPFSHQVLSGYRKCIKGLKENHQNKQLIDKSLLKSFDDNKNRLERYQQVFKQRLKKDYNHIRSKINLFDSANQEIQTFLSKANQYNISIINKIDVSAHAFTDEYDYKLILNECIRNAFKHTSANCDVIVSSEKKLLHYWIVVANKGMRIKHPKMIFKKEDCIGLRMCKIFAHFNNGNITYRYNESLSSNEFILKLQRFKLLKLSVLWK